MESLWRFYSYQRQKYWEWIENLAVYAEEYGAKTGFY